MGIDIFEQIAGLGLRSITESILTTRCILLFFSLVQEHCTHLNDRNGLILSTFLGIYLIPLFPLFPLLHVIVIAAATKTF